MKKLVKKQSHPYEMQITFVRVFIIITYVLCVICNLGRLSSWVSHMCHFYSLVRLYIYGALRKYEGTFYIPSFGR